MLYISSILLLFYLGGKGVIKNTEFLGQVVTSEIIVTFYMYISKFFNPIQSLADQFNFMQSAFASVEKIFTIMDMKPEVVDSPDAIELKNVKGNIEFKDVWFAYEGENWVLRGVSFKVDAAQAAGADYDGAEELVMKIQKENWFDFDTVITTPDMMGVVGRIGKLLGPKGLMPNPKSGTVTPDVAKAVKDVKAGKVEYRLDKTAVIHCVIGKKSFGKENFLKTITHYLTLSLKPNPLLQRVFTLRAFL